MSGWREILGAFEPYPYAFNPCNSSKSLAPSISRDFRDIRDGVSAEGEAGEVFEERAAIIECGAGVPRDWAEGYARLVTMSRPGTYCAARWQQILDDGGQFLDRWANDAARLGWDAANVFGVAAAEPEARIDGKGVVALLRGWAVQGIAADRVTVTNSKTGNSLSIYRRANTAGRVFLWEISA